jgi:N-acetyl-gamma-glutamyl-phosphate reductase
MIRVAIVGASGYGGGELIRWLARHPEVRVEHALSSTYAGQPVSAAFPGLAGRVDLHFSPSDFALAQGSDVVFLAGEAGLAMGHAKELVDSGSRVIDLSADLRFRSAAAYEQWYGSAHSAPELTERAVYGLPEIHREAIASARVVGNPGCYTTASILGLAPLVSEGLIDLGTITIDGKSGVSGAGRSKRDLAFHFPEANESVTAYKTGGTHRHTGEIEQELSLLAGQNVQVSFTPHLVPMTRGILVSAYAKLRAPTSKETLDDLYRAFYAAAPFVAVVGQPPSTKHTLGSNMLHVSVSLDARTGTVSVFSALDNLGKGMAGQAIQNMNLMLDLPQTTGLEVAPLWP